jgi:hypothetical protein
MALRQSFTSAAVFPAGTGFVKGTWSAPGIQDVTVRESGSAVGQRIRPQVTHRPAAAGASGSRVARASHGADDWAEFI